LLPLSGPKNSRKKLLHYNWKYKLTNPNLHKIKVVVVGGAVRPSKETNKVKLVSSALIDPLFPQE
jgi:hypothetical protein